MERLALYRNVLYSLIKPFREKRMARFFEYHKPDKNTKILDVGGTSYNWELVDYTGNLTILNIAHEGINSHYKYITGDAGNLDFQDNSFDLGFSNSVIEHVYTWDNQVKFANEIRRACKGLWVQTPAKSFFLEPHFLTPFFHFLPKSLQKKLSKFSVLGLMYNPPKEKLDGMVDELRLLTYREMKILFPDCKIIKERFLFFTKCYIAVR